MPKFMHIRHMQEGVVSGKGGCTVAYSEITKGNFVYAIAHCHPHDNYNKALGRAKAAGRLKSKKDYLVADAPDVRTFLNGLRDEYYASIGM